MGWKIKGSSPQVRFRRVQAFIYLRVWQELPHARNEGKRLVSGYKKEAITAELSPATGVALLNRQWARPLR
jgi:hypothetical protein